MQPNQFVGVKNASSLADLSPESFLNNLQQRYDSAFSKEGNSEDGGCGIYTWVGTVLVAVNPYKRLNVYGPSHIDHHYRKTIAHADPHPYGIASHAYCSMQKTKSPQSVIISGESGSGKTETSKYVLEFLTKVSGDNIGGYDATKVLRTSPILEAFGNAKTSRNENSSRFGKSIRLTFDRGSGKILTGARIDTYLLARSRITHTPPGERNYHIFYLLANGLSTDNPLRAELFLEGLRSNDFKYLQGESRSLYMSDSDFLDLLLESFRSIGFSSDLTRTLFRMVAAVAWLGNVDISPNPTNMAGASLISIDSEKALANAASLLEIDIQHLRLWLTKQRITAGRSEVMWADVSYQKCRMFRDAFAKMVYSRLFDWLVAELNIVLAPTSDCSTPKSDFPRFSILDACTPPGGYKNCDEADPEVEYAISILDIFGFENMDVNGLEQLCINFANEKIHRFFLTNVVVSEVEEYNREAIRYVPVTPADNKQIVEVIELGIIESLRRSTVDSMFRPIDSKDYDLDFCEKIASLQQSSMHVSVNKSTARNSPSGFKLRHFAGEVNYSTDGFVESNKDSDQRVDALLSLSGNRILSALSVPTVGTRNSVEEDSVSSASFSPGSHAPGTSLHSKRCIASSFVKQVDGLLFELNKTRGHYIKCIKPNEKKSPKIFDYHRVREQLQVGGMFEVLVMMAWAYPTRIAFLDVFSRYKSLLGDNILRMLAKTGASSARLFTEETLKLLATDVAPLMGLTRSVLTETKDYAMGTSKLFLKIGKVEPLEELLAACDRDSVVSSRVATIISSRIMQRRRNRQIAFIKLATRFVILLRRGRNFRKWFQAYFRRLAVLIKVIKCRFLPLIYSRRIRRNESSVKLQRWFRRTMAARRLDAIQAIVSVSRSLLASFNLRHVIPTVISAKREKELLVLRCAEHASEAKEQKQMVLEETQCMFFRSAVAEKVKSSQLVEAKQLLDRQNEEIEVLKMRDAETRETSKSLAAALENRSELELRLGHLNSVISSHDERIKMAMEEVAYWRRQAVENKRAAEHYTALYENVIHQ